MRAAIIFITLLASFLPISPVSKANGEDPKKLAAQELNNAVQSRNIEKVKALMDAGSDING